MTTAVKNDGAKAPVHLLPPESIIGAARAMAHGTKTYGPRNWEIGLNFSRIYAAQMRHLLAWWGGEDIDPESGVHHLHHASACALMLASYVERGRTDLDDRPTGRQARKRNELESDKPNTRRPPE